MRWILLLLAITACAPAHVATLRCPPTSDWVHRELCALIGGTDDPSRTCGCVVLGNEELTK